MGDVNLHAEVPFIRVRASTTKNRKDAVLTLHGELVEALRHDVDLTRPAGTPVFPEIPGMGVYRADLAKAGIAFLDATGRRADFHALRKTAATLMLALGVPHRLVQSHMRHSTIELTTRTYTDASQPPVADAMQNLPRLLPLENHSHRHSQESDFSGPPVSGGVTPLRLNSGLWAWTQSAEIAGQCATEGAARGVVRPAGLEPARCYSLEPESSASANSATGAQSSGEEVGGRAGSDKQFFQKRLDVVGSGVVADSSPATVCGPSTGPADRDLPDRSGHNAPLPSIRRVS